mmetsp:Transcript_20289/g.51920  ORF Transcript_20289/g.51920 Transcript_20289/m.51920 type:complete len:105 (+) Transcript_20289:8158-8472(+)
MSELNPDFHYAMVEGPVLPQDREMTARLEAHHHFVSEYLDTSKQDRIMALEQMRADYGRFTLLPDNNFREFVIMMLYDIIERLEGEDTSASADHQRAHSRRRVW